MPDRQPEVAATAQLHARQYGVSDCGGRSDARSGEGRPCDSADAWRPTRGGPGRARDSRNQRGHLARWTLALANESREEGQGQVYVSAFRATQ